MIDGFTKLLSNSEIFTAIDDAINIKSRIKDLISKDKVNINDELNRAKLAVGDQQYIDYIRNNPIYFIHAQQNPLSKAVMFIPMLQNNKPVLYVNITHLAKATEIIVKGEKTMVHQFHTPQLLLNTLEAAAVCHFVFNNYGSVIRNFNVKKSISTTYVNLLLATLNRIMSLGVRGDNVDVMSYILYRYYSHAMFGMKDSEETLAFCRTMSKTINNPRVKLLESKYTIEFHSLTSVLEKILVDTFPQFAVLVKDGKDKPLNALIKYFTLQFGELSLLGIDYLPYACVLAISEKYDFAIHANKNIKTTCKIEAFDAATELRMIFRKYGG